MKLLARYKKYRRSDFKGNVIEQRPWYFFSWEVSFILFFGFIAALMNMIPIFYGDGETITFSDGAGGIDSYAPNALRDNIVYFSIAMAITIISAIFIGVYTEMGQYLGKYSSALFVLVPTLVWLLSDRADNHIEHIIATSKLLENIVFYTIVVAIGLFVSVKIYKWIRINYYRSEHKIRRTELATNVLYRIIIVIVNISVLIMLSYSLINYGIFTLHLADISAAKQKIIFEETGAASGLYNLHSENFITFIAVVSLFFALLMVSIGLTNTFSSDKAVGITKAEAAEDDDIESVTEVQEKKEEELYSLKPPGGKNG